MSPVSVVAKPTFASRRWIGPDSVAENGTDIALGDTVGEGSELGDAGTTVLGGTDALGADSGALPAHSVTSSAMRHMLIRMRRPYVVGHQPS